MMDINSLRDRLSRPIDILVNTQDERWYKTDGNPWKPSVTSVISSVLNKGRGFEMWLGNQPSYKIACQERDESARLGTAVHSACEAYLKGEVVNGGENEWKDEFNKRMMQFEHWVTNVKPEIITLEYQMYHPDVPFSGTPDIIAYIPEKGLCLIDIKTGAPYENHELQLTCYKLLWDTLFPDMPITSLYGLYLKGNWISKVEPNFKQYKYVPEAVEHIVGLWRWMHSETGPKGRKPVKTIFKMKKELVEDENL
tara:strand:+ start:723 stop:1481 length:759 start_codon:yes stop_codon:yes gene_type:complete